MVAAIVILGLTTGLLGTLLLRTTRALNTTRDALKGEVLTERRNAAQSAAEARRLEAQVRDLVSGRLPKQLLEMVTDTLIGLEPAPLRSILFTQTGTAERPGYEYRLICKNAGPERFQPRLRILLFNETGIQTGSADLGDSADATRMGAAGMAVGESGSFSGRITLEFDDTPKYFIILSLDRDGRLPRLSR
jgi:hypothetical protein